ncbi:MAG: hypothetical protein J6V44_11595 [Methanobrevibacter sp.]|nr:hypothetical protein [Methanobrevibacter sp.]
MSMKEKSLTDLSTFDPMLKADPLPYKKQYGLPKVRIACARKADRIKMKIRKDFCG